MKASSKLLTRWIPVLAVLLLTACGERPPITAVQTGYRGTGMEQIYNPRILAAQAGLNQAPEPLPPLGSDGPKAGAVYQNVKVLGHLSVGEFTRLMVAMTQWVSPKEGCNYCHLPTNLADDSVYTKVVARRMIEMTQTINNDWKSHVANTGVTCYTCHRGNPVPSQVWFAPGDRRYSNSLLGDRAGQNVAAPAAGLSSLPFDPFTPYLKESLPIRVNGDAALAKTGAAANRASTKQVEFTYSLMMHMSSSLGVNCTYCHNTRAFGEWDESPPARATAWHGIRMARLINNNYIEPLTASFPAHRLGPQGDVAKVNCGTCHQGAWKPLYGAEMAKHHPELLAAAPPRAAAPAAPAPAAAAPAVPTGGNVYFPVGSSSLQSDQADAIAKVVEAMKTRPTTVASISGYHSATGDLAVNQELAKKRAFAVRDALLAAGIPESRLQLDKPAQTEANPSGEERAARRVEVNLK